METEVVDKGRNVKAKVMQYVMLYVMNSHYYDIILPDKNSYYEKSIVCCPNVDVFCNCDVSPNVP